MHSRGPNGVVGRFLFWETSSELHLGCFKYSNNRWFYTRYMVSFISTNLFEKKYLTWVIISACHLGGCIWACVDARQVSLEKKRNKLEGRKIGYGPWS
jgi:hypothetical protein